jgi:hypothetical protein
MNAPSHGARLRWFEYLIALLPLGLVGACAFGLFAGALAFAIGPAACAFNLAIMQSSRSRALKIGAALGVGILAAIAWSLAIFLL